jgi:hypothetical protein
MSRRFAQQLFALMGSRKGVDARRGGALHEQR